MSSHTSREGTTVHTPRELHGFPFQHILRLLISRSNSGFITEVPRRDRQDFGRIQALLDGRFQGPTGDWSEPCVVQKRTLARTTSHSAWCHIFLHDSHQRPRTVVSRAQHLQRRVSRQGEDRFGQRRSSLPHLALTSAKHTANRTRISSRSLVWKRQANKDVCMPR